MPDEFLTIAEVAEMLKLNQQTVRNMIDRGEMGAVRVGQRRVRVRQSQLDAFLAAGETTHEPGVSAAAGLDKDAWRGVREAAGAVAAAVHAQDRDALDQALSAWRTLLAGYSRVTDVRARPRRSQTAANHYVRLRAVPLERDRIEAGPTHLASTGTGGGRSRALACCESVNLPAGGAGTRVGSSAVTDQPTGVRSRTIRMLLVRARRRSSASSRSLGARSVDQRLPISRISPDPASWRSRSKRPGLVQPGGFGDPRGGVLALGQLAQHPAHAILARRRGPLSGGRDGLRGAGRDRVGPLAGGSCRRSVSVAGSAGGAQHHRLAAVPADNRELAPPAAAATNGAAPSSALDHGQGLGIQWFHSAHDRSPPKPARYLSVIAESEHRRADTPGPEHLAATAFIDAEHPTVRAFTERAVANAASDRERISRLFTAVRDEIRYDPYQLSHDPRDYIASNVISRGVAFCIPKAVALTAAARSLGIPARLGFSDVKNHLQSPKLAERMGTDIFVFHGYSELYLHDTWRKATPAFNAELCERFSVPPLTFDGSAGALLHPFAADGSAYMQYIRDRGVYADLPLGPILEVFATAYPRFGTGEATADDPAFSA